jgi:aromatic ring hydroxylase
MAAKKVATDTNKKQKPEEQALQVLYVDSEENLTAVRERLEHTSAHSIALVIPSQTQLHSPVAWRLLYRYTREMGKDVSVVSSDPQVRAIAQSAQFKVASSLR